MKKLLFFLLINFIFVFISLPSLAIGQENLIYIRENGTVEGTDKIQRDGAVYTLTGTILGKRVIVEKSSITIDGNGTLLGYYNGFEGVITLHNVKNVVIKNCFIKNCVYGIELNSSSNITILGNKISEADIPMYWIASAINILGESSNINIIGNEITNNKWGILVYVDEPPNLVIHHNNFVENSEEDVYIWRAFSATWDDGKEGNYWSTYNVADRDGDGIGDTSYVINGNNQDKYPFIVPITFFNAGTWGGENHKVDVVSNCTVSDFVFYPEDARLQFNLTGTRWTSAFCRVTIPKEMLSTETDWAVLVDNSSVNASVDENEKNTYLYFTYHFPSYYGHSTKTVEIIGTYAIPEFPSWNILSLLIVAALVGVIVRNKNTKKV